MIVIRNLKRISLLFGLLLSAFTAALAQNGQMPSYTYTGGEVSNLVAPVALYPDPLLAIILPAATYPDQIANAENMNLGDNEHAIDRQDWDISVKALAHYPHLLAKMANDPDWTASLGQAYVGQPQDVMDAIQFLRHQARANGVLRSMGQQRVYLEGDYIRIVPAQAEMIYVPQYDPDVVYLERPPHYNLNLLTFGAGLVIGVWLSNDTDWGHHRVYNTGWQGSGWVANSRSHVTINNVTNIYIANRNQPAMVNRNVMHRQINRGKVHAFNLSATHAFNPQASAHRAGLSTMNPRSVTRPNMQRSVARPNVTTANSSHRPSAASYRSGTNNPAKQSAQRHTTGQPNIKRQMPSNRRQGNQVAGQQQKSARQATSRQAAPRQATPRQSAPRQPTRQTAPRQATRQTAPRQATRQSAPRQAAPRQAAPRQTTRQAAPRQSAPRQTTRQAAPRQAAPRQAAPRQSARQSPPNQRQGKQTGGQQNKKDHNNDR